MVIPAVHSPSESEADIQENLTLAYGDLGLGFMLSTFDRAGVSPYTYDDDAYTTGRSTLVRVRRIRYACYGLPDIAISCRREILELSCIPVLENTNRQLSGPGP